MTLFDAARRAREKADATGDSFDVALADALEAAEAAEFHAIGYAETPPADIEGIPPRRCEGFDSKIFDTAIRHMRRLALQGARERDRTAEWEAWHGI
jgi:hypothetical protein